MKDYINEAHKSSYTFLKLISLLKSDLVHCPLGQILAVDCVLWKILSLLTLWQLFPF